MPDLSDIWIAVDIPPLCPLCAPLYLLLVTYNGPTTLMAKRDLPPLSGGSLVNHELAG